MEHNMVVLFVTPDFPGRNEPLTGFPAYLYRVSLALIDMGYKPIILAGGQRSECWIYKGIEIIRVKTDSFNRGNDSLNYIITSCMKSCQLNQEIKKLASKMKIDIIQFTSLWGTALLYYGKTPAVMRLSSYAKTYFASYETYTKEYVNAMAWMERLSSRRCNAVFAPCRITANAFSLDIKRKVYTIETPFVEDAEIYDNIYINSNLKNKKYVLFFGTLYPDKGIKVIGQCLRRFLEKNIEYHFVFVGEAKLINGENAANMLRRCARPYADRVVILPAISHKQLYPIIQRADFVVLPSLMDNFPNACIEAMYFGKVVIGTDGASFEQLIQHKVSGLLCKIGDSDDLLEKMQMAVSMDENVKREMSNNARKRIERLKPEIVVKQLVDFYSYVINAVANK